MSRNLISLVEKLRREQEFVTFYKHQIRQSVQELNNGCDQVFHSLWLSHTLSYGLHRVLTHNSHVYEWSHAHSRADSVKFVNASKVIKSFHFVDRYSKFLTNLLQKPELLSEILHCVDAEGMDCSWVVNDLISVVYGHCVFKKDHMFFLKLIRELLKQHIERCESPKDLFGGVESVFNHVLTEYCSQLVELRIFLTEVLHEPLMQVLSCEEYLEYDVNKAGNRFQTNSEHSGLIASSAFMFNEDLESSCKKLAELATQFLQNLSLTTKQFPVSLKWLLGNLKTMVKQKWPRISPSELRRPISDAVFSSILSSAIVNPDSYGVVDPSVIVSEVGRYNLAQIMSVLQGCVWIMDKSSSNKYPIHKVVHRIDVSLFFSLVDCIDDGWTDDIPDLPSFLPGLNRSAFLASQQQLNNLVGLVAMLVANRENKRNFHLRISTLLNCLLPGMIEQASHNPYPISSKPVLPPPSHSTNPVEQEKVKSMRRKTKKPSGGNLEMLDGGTLITPVQEKKGKVLMSPQPVTDGRASKTSGEKQMKRSISNDTGLSAAHNEGFRLPKEVLVFPVLENQEEEGVAQWDFYLLTEDEFMSQKSQSPSQKSEDQFYFASLLHPQHTQPLPRKLNRTASAEILSPDYNSNQTDSQIRAKRLAAREMGRVKSMIDAIEYQQRARSHTLPTVLSDVTFRSSEHDNHMHSVSSSPNHSLSLSPNEHIRKPIEHQSETDHNRKSPTILVRPFTKGPITKFPNTIEALVDESVNYVKIHPPPLENENSIQESEAIPKEGEGRDQSPVKVVTPPPLSLAGVENQAHAESISSSTLGLDTSDELDPGDVAQSESLSNLFQQDEEGEGEEEEGGEKGGSPRLEISKKKKKKRWKLHVFRKHTKSSEEREVESEVVKGRSPSLPAMKKEGVALRVKERSKSHEFLDGNRIPQRKVDRYTLYMKDYSAKWEERKKNSPKRDSEEREGQSSLLGVGTDDVDGISTTDDDLDRIDVAPPPAEMSPLAFEQSLFCNQLKYKLRAALQNIHTPLSLSPTYLTIQADADSNCDTRCQLILLIRHALQRSQWKHDDMEIALLSEILRMVEPLPNDLIEVAVEGVFEDYHKRSSYVAYLVCSQQKFQDAKMQVATVQDSINRIMDINRALFVNFAVRTFLESSGQPRLSQLKDFSQKMESLFLADEKCSLMNHQLNRFKTAIEEDSMTWGEHWQDREKVFSCLGDYLFTYVYQNIFYPNGSTDKEIDKIFYDHLATLSKTITLNHRSLQIPMVYHSGCPWLAAQRHLKAMSAYKSPRGKLHCIVQSLRILISLLQYARCGDPPGADDLFPVLVYILIKANPSGMLSTCQYIRNFAETSLQGEDAYWWAQFSTAVEFTKTLS